MFDCSNYTAELKHYDDSNKLVVGKMKHETGGVAIKEFSGLKMCSFLLDDSINHKKQKTWIKMFSQQQARVNTKMFCWTIDAQDIR